MRLICSQKNLINALVITSKAVDTNNTLPVLRNVLLKAEGKKLYFTSTNLEVAISCNIDADIKNEGEITIPSKLFTNYVNYLKDGDVEISIEGEDIQIITKDSKTRVSGIPSLEFPSIPNVEREGGFSVSIEELSRAINQVVFAAAVNTTRPILSGVYFVVNDNKLTLVATDSYRLSEKNIPISDLSGEIQCIIPAKTILELGSIIDTLKDEKNVNIIVSKNQVMFSVGRVELTSRLIEGKFPNYQQIIPKESKTRFEFDVPVISLAIKRINIFAKENNNKIILKILDGKIILTTESTQYGEGEITLDVSVDGEVNEVALNSQFLLDLLGNISSGKVVFELLDKIAPIVLKSKNSKDYTHVIMPLKI